MHQLLVRRHKTPVTLLATAVALALSAPVCAQDAAAAGIRGRALHTLGGGARRARGKGGSASEASDCSWQNVAS